MKLTDLILKITALVLAVAAIGLPDHGQHGAYLRLDGLSVGQGSGKERTGSCRTCPCEGCESDDEFEEWDI